MSPIVLETVPNVSEGRDERRVEDIGRAFATHGCRLLDVHSDPAYNRSVFTLVGDPQEIADTLVAGARAAIECIDMRTHDGAHPCIGALDVVPIVYLTEADRANARDEALAVANRIAAELDLPVFMYGELASAPERRERSHFREGGVLSLAERMRDGELAPDFGPARPHPTAGATLVAARPPLVAFNVELDTADVDVARAIAAAIRERDGGLPGVRAIGVAVGKEDASQISTNVHDPFRVPLAVVVETVREEAAKRGAGVRCAELVGLAPAGSLDGFPADVEIRGFEPRRHVLEQAIGRHVPSH
jgi:glutamate formiminotransferase/glutamate formiminotransferase/formiminotetrahydrofolate cyclodeaminase